MTQELGAQKAMAAVVGEQKLNDAQRRLLGEMYARLATFTDGCREIHDRAKEARKIILLQDPKQDVHTYTDLVDGQEVTRKEPTLQLQTLKSTFNNCVADQIDNMPEAILMPERPELSPVTEDMNDVVRFVLAQNDFEAFHKRRVEDFLSTGTAVTQIAWDPDMDFGRGNIAIIRYPIESFLWDPLAEDIQDARALIKVSWHPLSYFAAHYPEKAAYVQAEDGQHNGVGVLLAQEERPSAEEPRAMLMEYWYRLYDAKTKRYTVSVAYAAGGALLSIHEDIYKHGLYPFVLDVFTPIEGIPVGDGLVQELAPMMRYINRYARYIDTNLRYASKGRLLIRRACGIDKEALSDWSKDIIEGDNIDPGNLQWLQHAPFNGMAAQQMMQLQTDLKMDSGQNQFARGETAGGVTAASAISALQEAGNKQNRMRTATLNQGFRQMVMQVMWLMAQFYDRKRKTLIVGSRGEQREVDMSPERLFQNGRKSGVLPPPPYMVQVQVQRRNPIRVQAQNELYMQAYGMATQAGVPFPLSKLFEMMNVDGKDKIMPILRESDMMTKKLEELAAQNEQLSMTLANMQKTNDKYAQLLGGGAGPGGGMPVEGQQGEMPEEGLPPEGMMMEAGPEDMPEEIPEEMMAAMMEGGQGMPQGRPQEQPMRGPMMEGMQGE